MDVAERLVPVMLLERTAGQTETEFIGARRMGRNQGAQDGDGVQQSLA